MVETLNADGTAACRDAAAGPMPELPTVDRDIGRSGGVSLHLRHHGALEGRDADAGNLLSNAETLADYWRFTASDVLLHALPIFHTHGLFVATNITLLVRAGR
jgi:malonyl-CoA/methylmalonyl-CoA synthetase